MIEVTIVSQAAGWAQRDRWDLGCSVYSDTNGCRIVMSHLRHSTPSVRMLFPTLAIKYGADDGLSSSRSRAQWKRALLFDRRKSAGPTFEWVNRVSVSFTSVEVLRSEHKEKLPRRQPREHCAVGISRNSFQLQNRITPFSAS
jgi:hypothetical protein